MLNDTIEKDFIHAYKQKDDVRVRVLRLIKTAIKNLHVELKRSPTDEEILSIIQKQTKQRKDSIEQFMQAKRMDLAQKEEEELQILVSYLPEQLTGEKLRETIQNTVKELSISSKKEFGKVMGYITKQYAGRVDGKEVQAIVEHVLSELE